MYKNIYRSLSHSQRPVLCVRQVFRTLTVKNNRVNYSTTAVSFLTKGSLAFRGEKVVINHAATKVDDDSTFWAVKKQVNLLDTNTCSANATASAVGHDAGEATCVVIGTRQVR